jgi:hypothetical protein
MGLSLDLQEPVQEVKQLSEIVQSAPERFPAERHVQEAKQPSETVPYTPPSGSHNTTASIPLTEARG